jgi:hypothetical protein
MTASHTVSSTVAQQGHFLQPLPRKRADDTGDDRPTACYTCGTLCDGTCENIFWVQLKGVDLEKRRLERPCNA